MAEERELIALRDERVSEHHFMIQRVHHVGLVQGIVPINTTLREKGFNSRNVHRLLAGGKCGQTEIKFALSQCLAKGRKELNSNVHAAIPRSRRPTCSSTGFFQWSCRDQ